MVYFDDYETTIASESRTKYSHSILCPDHNGIFQCVNSIGCHQDRTDRDYYDRMAGSVSSRTISRGTFNESLTSDGRVLHSNCGRRDETLDANESKKAGFSSILNEHKLHEQHSPQILSEELVCRHSEDEDYNCFDGTLSELSQSCSESDSNYEHGDCDGCSEVQSITLNSYSPLETNLLQRLPNNQPTRPNFASLLQCIDISTPISTSRPPSNNHGIRHEKVQKSIHNSRNKENTGYNVSEIERYYNMKLKFSPNIQRLQSLNTFATRLFPHDQNIHMSHKETPQKIKEKIKYLDTLNQEMNWKLSQDGHIQNCWELTTNLGYAKAIKQNAQTIHKYMPSADKRGHQELKATYHSHRELQYGLYEI